MTKAERGVGGENLLEKIKENRDEIREMEQEEKAAHFRTSLGKYLDSSGLKHNQLSRYANVDREYLDKVLTGVRNPPRRSVIVRLINVLSHFLPEEAGFDIEEKGRLLNFAGFSLTMAGAVDSPLVRERYPSSREWERELRKRQVFIPGETR